VEIAGNLHAVIDGFHFSWGGETFSLGISIGVVPVDRSAIDLASTLSAADSACYIAKESGRNRTQIAHLGDKRLQERHGQMQWVPRITRAIEEGRMALYFQSITPLDHNARQGEASIRLRHQRRSLPGCCRDRPEKSGLRRVLRSGCLAPFRAGAFRSLERA